MTALVGLLIAILVLYVLLTRWTRRQRAAVGLEYEALESADDSSTPVPTLRSRRYGLVGRPDQLVRVGRLLIPVEHKPTARRLQPSQVLQVAAQCLLVQDVYGVRPPYGLVVLAGGTRQRVDFSAALEHRLLETMAEMRAFLHASAAPEPRWISRNCRPCSFRETCWTPDAPAA